MAAMPERTTVPLPCDRTEEWSDTQKFLLLLSQSKCTEDLSTLISSAGARKDQGMSGRDCLLRGLHRFLKVHCSSKEQSTFFTVVLPGICRLASQLPAFCPAEGIPFIRAQEGACAAFRTPGLCVRTSGHGGRDSMCGLCAVLVCIRPVVSVCMRLWMCACV